MSDLTCGFYAVNGKHCVVSGQCIVCQGPYEPQLQKGETITLQNFGPLDGDYEITGNRDGRLQLKLLKGEKQDA